MNKSRSLPGSKNCIAADYRINMEDEITAGAALRDELRSIFSRVKLLITARNHGSALSTEMLRIDERFSDAHVSSGLIEKGSGEAALNKKGKGFCQKFEFLCSGVGGSFGCAERL